MKAKTVKYEKLVTTENFCNEKYGIEIRLEDGDTAAQCMEEAVKFVALWSLLPPIN